MIDVVIGFDSAECQMRVSPCIIYCIIILHKILSVVTTLAGGGDLVVVCSAFFLSLESGGGPKQVPDTGLSRYIHTD